MFGNVTHNIRIKEFIGLEAATNFNSWMDEPGNQGNKIEKIEIRSDHLSIMVIYRKPVINDYKPIF